MKIVIFGSTGLIGKELVKQALYNGNQVLAYGRNVFTEDLPKDNNLELVQGALFDEDQVYGAIKGCDAVVAALGGSRDSTDKTRSLGMKNIVLQTEKAGVKRIVALGNMGILDAEDGKLIMDQDNFPAEDNMVSQEYAKAFAFLKASNLNWTVVCPAKVLDKPPTGVFGIAINQPPLNNTFSIGSGDLALFMLKELNHNDHVHERVGISN